MADPLRIAALIAGGALLLRRPSAIPPSELGPAQGPFPASLTGAGATPASPQRVVRLDGAPLDGLDPLERASALEAAAPGAGATPLAGPSRIGSFLLGIVADVLRLGVAQFVPIVGPAIARAIPTPRPAAPAPAAAPGGGQLVGPTPTPTPPRLDGDYAPSEAEIGYDPGDLIVTHEIGAETATGTVQTVRGTREFTFEVPFPEVGFGD